MNNIAKIAFKTKWGILHKFPALSKAAGRTGLVLAKHSPEILTTLGVVGLIGSTVMACRATLKAEVVLDEARNKD